MSDGFSHGFVYILVYESYRSFCLELMFYNDVIELLVANLVSEFVDIRYAVFLCSCGTCIVFLFL